MYRTHEVLIYISTLVGCGMIFLFVFYSLYFYNKTKFKLLYMLAPLINVRRGAEKETN